MLLPETAIPVTVLGIGFPGNPDHDVPFHLASLFVATPPAVVKSPPTRISSPLEMIVVTQPFPPLTPVPKGAHTDPFQTAILLAVTPPILPNLPPAYTFPPTTATAEIKLFSVPRPDTPDPSVDQVLVTLFHLAIRFAVTDP